MGRLVWFALGALSVVIVAFVATRWPRRVELALGSAPESTPATAEIHRWGIELNLLSEVRSAVPPAEPEPAAMAGPELEEPAAPRPFTARDPRPKPQRPPAWTAGPVLVDYHDNGELHFRGQQVRTAEGGWVREGPWKAWHENGVLHEDGGYLAGHEQGDWRWWYADGTPMSKGRFIDGKRVGPWTFWHENGRVMMQGQYEDGDGVGRWVYFHENGMKKAEGDFRAGKPAGCWTVWLEDGRPNLDRTGEYVDGVLVQ